MKVVVAGAGGHGKVVLAICARLPDMEVVGYTDQADRGTVLGAEWLGDDHVWGDLVTLHPGLGLALGIGALTPEQTALRRRLMNQAREAGLALPPLVAPTAVLSPGVALGEGTVVADGVFLGPDATVGQGCILNSHASVDHDCRLGDHVHIAPGATLSGGVTVEQDCLVGAGATIIHYRTVAAGTIIGAGAAVVQDCTKPGLYVGVPARRKLR